MSEPVWSEVRILEGRVEVGDTRRFLELLQCMRHNAAARDFTALISEQMRWHGRWGIFRAFGRIISGIRYERTLEGRHLVVEYSHCAVHSLWSQLITSAKAKSYQRHSIHFGMNVLMTWHVPYVVHYQDVTWTSPYKGGEMHGCDNFAHHLPHEWAA